MFKRPWDGSEADEVTCALGLAAVHRSGRAGPRQEAGGADKEPSVPVGTRTRARPYTRGRSGGHGDEQS
eukprot:6146826-Alexandrium_andersonii.AAC.1